MRSFYLSLAVLAVTAVEPSAAIQSTGGLLRDRKQNKHRELRMTGNNNNNNKGSKGMSSSKGKGYALSPSCPAPCTGKSKGKGGKGGRGNDSSTSGQVEEDVECSYKGKGKGGKSSDNGRFLNELRDLQRGKGKGKSGGSGDGCDCDYPTDLCEGEEMGTVQCGDVITQDTILSTSLGCEMGPAPGVRVAITVVGATLECTGDGDNMIYGTTDASGTEVCVILRDGATLKNCAVHNCDTGVVMQGNGNNRIIGSKIFGNQRGVETANSAATGFPELRPVPEEGDTGCYTIECTEITGNGDDGIVVQHNGNMIISNTNILGTEGIGVTIAPWAERTTPSGVVLPPYEVDVAFEDVNIFGSGLPDGSVAIHIGSSRVTGTGTIGEVGFYGDTKVVGASVAIADEDFGNALAGSDPPTLVVYGGLESYGTTGDAYLLNDAVLMMSDGSTTLACTSAGDDFSLTSVSQFQNMGTDLTCTDSTVPIGCPVGTCPSMTSTAFTCSAGGDGSSKGKGGKGGKGKSSN